MIYKTQHKKYWYGGLVAILFMGAFAFMTIKYLRQSKRANDALIAEHIEKLQRIFKDINDCCKINAFRPGKNHIDFLNVSNFEGTVVGPMSLLEPKNWRGPYMNESLTIDGKEYQIVSTKKGYYIVPGDGVTLANGKVIGKTLVINNTTDIDALMHDPQGLMSSQGKPLAARIEITRAPGESEELHESSDDLERWVSR